MKEEDFRSIHVVIGLLAERFPKTFFVYERRRKPLKIGIHLDILAALDGALMPRELAVALRFYTGNVGYLRSALCGAWRLDLAGNPAGMVDQEQEAAAKRRLTGMAAKQARRKAAKARPKHLSLADLKAAGRARAAATITENLVPAAQPKRSPA